MMPRPLAVLAEDEFLIRMEAADLLDALGFEVLEAGHAAAALQHLEARAGAALLYTDIRMPGRMDGCTLAHTCAVRWPRTRIIVCSGCLPDEAAQLPACAQFIAKPCAETLVRRALKALQIF
ncbi:response regulator [Methylobacterium radiotolerans]|uniref:response regulator n=1 Tax=Methylobacterium radiotolerans TaxID=31998 RepID=UPI001F1B57B1|nr:response regulator [Methylobacterium radiotolerans]UIY43528.1 response regulator [Methylobacterium radiotolerans]